MPRQKLFHLDWYVSKDLQTRPLAEMLATKTAEQGIKVETHILALKCDGASVNEAIARLLKKEE